MTAIPATFRPLAQYPATMSDIGLVPYEFFIKRRNRKAAYVDLTSFADGKYSGKEFLLEFFKFLEDNKYEVEDKEKRTFHLIDFTQDTDSVYGNILGGYYGDTASYFEAPTGKMIYERLEEHAEVRSYFFYVDMPSTSVGEYLILLQAYDYRGIKEDLFKRLQFFTKNYDNGKFAEKYTVYLNNIVPGSYLDVVASKIKIDKIRFTKKHGSMKIDDKSMGVGVDLQITPPKIESSSLAKRLVSYINGVIPNFSGVYSIPEEIKGFDYEDIKIVGKVDGKSTTLSIRDLSLPRFQFAVERDTLVTERPGQFKPESFLGDAHDFINRLKAEMAGKTPVPEDERTQE